MTLFGAGELTHWPELLPALINMLDSDNFSVCEVGLGLLFALSRAQFYRPMTVDNREIRII